LEWLATDETSTDCSIDTELLDWRGSDLIRAERIQAVPMHI
jgi:hypothetical protein